MKSKQSISLSKGSIESIGMGPTTTVIKSTVSKTTTPQPPPPLPQHSIDFSGLDLNQLPKLKEFTNAKLEPESGSPIGEYIYNCIGYIFYCPLHRRIMLSVNERNNSVWLPFIAIQSDKTWNMSTTEGIAIIFSKDDSEIDPRLVKTIPVQSINCVHILRIQLPLARKFIYRLIQAVTLDNGSTTDNQFRCCVSSKHLQWIDLNEAISANINGLWGPEVPMFASYLMDSNKSREISEIGFNVDHLIAQLGLSDLIAANQSQNRDIEQIMAECLHINKKDIEKIYSDFLEHCFPSVYMTYWSFCSYINDYFHQCDTLLQLFQAFNQNRCGYLTFQEFFTGIVSIEPGCPNTMQRIRFIFRYYDQQRCDSLNRDDFSKLLNDLNFSADQQSNIVQQIENFPINFEQFLQIIAANSDVLHMETLCRASSPLLTHIYRNFVQRNDTRILASYHKSRSELSQHYNRQITAQQRQRQDTSTSSASTFDKSHGPCLACRERNYEFGSHCVRFDPMGRCVEARNILEHEEIDSQTANDPTRMSTLYDDRTEMTMYKYSQDYVFSTFSIGPTFLDMLREFNSMVVQQQQQQQSKKDRHHQPQVLIGFFAGDDNTNQDLFIRYVTILCQNIRAIFDCEDKLMRINSPAYLIGDVDGDLPNLIRMERALWISVPVLANNYVFLGNYVNASGPSINQFGIECVLYLFALKLIAPNKFFLLRGHNECRQIQRNKFQAECIRKYGDKCGQILFELINDIFDHMPLAVILDETIICINNNLPIRSTTQIDQLNNIGTKELKDLNQHPMAKEMLLMPAKIFSTVEDNQCFEYLQRNDLQHLIRATGGHHTVNTDFHISSHSHHHQKRIINLRTTPMNTSNALNTKNIDTKLTTVLVDLSKIRIIKIDTTIE